MEVGPCIPVGIQLQRAEVGPTSGPTWRLSHLVVQDAREPVAPLEVEAGAAVLRGVLERRGQDVEQRRLLHLRDENPHVPHVDRLHELLADVLLQRHDAHAHEDQRDVAEHVVAPDEGTRPLLAFEDGLDREEVAEEERDGAGRLGFDRIVASEIEGPNMLANLV
jgi:hypothetical protein